MVSQFICKTEAHTEVLRLSQPEGKPGDYDRLPRELKSCEQRCQGEISAGTRNHLEGQTVNSYWVSRSDRKEDPSGAPVHHCKTYDAARKIVSFGPYGRRSPYVQAYCLGGAGK